MKKYFTLAILASLAIVGCSKVEPDNSGDSSEEQVAINFQAVNHVSQTKVTGTEYPTAAHFGSYALFTGSADFNADNMSSYTTYINDAEIYQQGEKGSYYWAAASPYYWPKSGKLTFLSYSPKSAELMLGTTAAGVLTKDNYSVKSYADQKGQADYLNDLMIATIQKDKTQSDTKTVAAEFNHALAKLHFGVKASTLSYGGVTYHMVVTSIAIKGAYTNGDIDWTGTAANWSNQDTPAEVVLYTNGAAKQSTGNDYTAITGELTEGTTYDRKMNDPSDSDMRDYYVIPQTLPALSKTNGAITSGAYVELSYTIYSCNGTKIMAVDDFTDIKELKSIKAGETAIDTWGANKSYAYNITISPLGEEIRWAPTVKVWDTEVAPEYDI